MLVTIGEAASGSASLGEQTQDPPYSQKILMFPVPSLGNLCIMNNPVMLIEGFNCRSTSLVTAIDHGVASEGSVVRAAPLRQNCSCSPKRPKRLQFYR